MHAALVSVHPTSVDLDCPKCGGHGFIGKSVGRPDREGGYSNDCRKCFGTGKVRCFDCCEVATRTSLTDRDIALCDDCGAKDDRGVAEFLAKLPISTETQRAWVALLPRLATSEVQRLCGLDDEAYAAEAERYVAAVREAA